MRIPTHCFVPAYRMELQPSANAFTCASGGVSTTRASIRSQQCGLLTCASLYYASGKFNQRWSSQTQSEDELLHVCCRLLVGCSSWAHVRCLEQISCSVGSANEDPRRKCIRRSCRPRCLTFSLARQRKPVPVRENEQSSISHTLQHCKLQVEMTYRSSAVLD